MPLTQALPRFTKFSHQYRRLNAPISPTKLHRILTLLDLNKAQAVLDIGCGTGEWSLQIAERAELSLTAMDTDSLALTEARARQQRRALKTEPVWREGDAKALLNEPRRYDRILCVGACHAFGNTEDALKVLLSLLEPGGLLLFGEGFWERPLTKEYTDFVDFQEPEALYCHARLVERAEELGFRALWATTATLEEWDEFEWEFYRVVELFEPDESEREAFEALRARRRRWRQGYLRFGRGLLGFGYHLLKKPQT